MDDSGIVERYLRRDETAIALTKERYGAQLRALSFGITQDRETAEECENDVYLEAWRSIPPHEPRTYLYAFLARIAAKSVYDIIPCPPVPRSPRAHCGR